MTFFTIFAIINLVIKMINRLTKQEYIINERFSASKKTFNGSYPTHWHEFYEIEFILSGKGTYSIDGKDYIVEPGMVFFMTPVNFHTLNVENVIMYNIMFTDNMCSNFYLSKIATENFPVALKINESDMPFLKSAADELVSNKDDFSYATQLLDTVVAKLEKIAGKGKKRKMSAISMAELYILNNFRNNLSLNQVAQYAGFSPSYFSALFKQTTGKTFKEYTTELKFEYAKKLLAFSALTVTQICIESGFDEYTNFIRRFKQRFGLSPGEYRKTRAI